MSLFKVCNWWTIQSSDISKSYDSFSLLCSRLNSEDSNEKDYVIIGSHNGLLAIYKPIFSQQEDEQYNSFAPSDVVLETKLEAPVIALSAGRFSTTGKNDSKNLLAVLHPTKLVIYGLVTSDGIADHGDFSKLQLIQEHELKSHAFSICKGNFGGSKGREFLCVFHMDGSLKFFEQDGITFECKLPDDRTIPSTWLYISRIDCFITVSPAWDLECFRYQDLIDSQQLKKKIVPIWTVCIGEGILDISISQVSNTESLIVLLGEHNLLCLSDTGKIKFIRRLDYTPICFCSFVIGWYWEPNARLITAVVSDNSSLLIYENTGLVWAAQLSSSPPVAIKRSNITGLPGAIVTLNEKGTINVGYLGSDPHLFKAPPLDLKQLDFQKAHMELIELEKQIQQGVDFSDVKMTNAAAERDIRTQITLHPTLESCPYTSPLCQLLENEQKKMIRVSIAIKPNILLEQVQVAIFVMPPLKSTVERFVFRDVDADQTERLDTYIYMERSLDVPCLDIQIIISCINKQSIARVIEQKIKIPLELVFKMVQAQRDAKYKITLIVDDHGYKDLTTLFFDSLSFKENNATAQSIGFRSMYTGNVVTIAIAKNSKRYRIQSDYVEAIFPIFIYLIEKLQVVSKDRFHDKEKSVVPKVHITPPFMPIEILIGLIQEHYSKRAEFNNVLLEIDRRYAELRLFEARYAVKSQEENAKVTGIQYLIDLTNSKLAVFDKRGKLVQDELQTTQIRLSSVILLIKTMLNHIGLHTKTAGAISNALNSCVNDYLEQSWEESIFPAFDMLEFVGPLRNKKDKIAEDYFSSVTSGQVEFEFKKLLKYIENSLATVVQMSIKLGNTNEKIDDFDETDKLNDIEVIEADKSEWTSDTLPAGTAVLIGSGNNSNLQLNAVETIQQLETTKILEQVHEVDEPDSIEPKMENDSI